MLWKKQVSAFDETDTDDPILAAQRLQADDGMSTGIVFRREFTVFQPETSTGGDLESIEREFAI
jgi:2-oxoglutarate ferredoxin oxidoreductase subunit beta